MKKTLEKIINTGVKDSYKNWEVHLTRKLNSMVLISIANMIVGIIFFSIIDLKPVLYNCIVSLTILPFIILVNNYKNYTWTFYLFYSFSFIFFIHLNLSMGINSYMILWYFPVTLSMLQLLGRKELLKHLIVISIICILSIIAITIGFKTNLFYIPLSTSTVKSLISFNIILSFITAISFMIIIVFESINQEDKISKMLREKEILVAEVFHRVKNNLNIVTSILNLKKNMSDSKEVQIALEDCRSRVFSMALVHQNIFNHNIIGLNFEAYIKKLVAEISNSYAEEKNIDIVLKTEMVNLELSNAIPCGLILNELITNSYKYAKQENKKLLIEIKLTKSDDNITLVVRDNGPGVNVEIINKNNTLGLELIKSLSDQINGIYSFHNDKGLVFNLRFNSNVQIKKKNELFSSVKL